MFAGRVTLLGDKDAAAELRPLAEKVFARLEFDHPRVSGMVQRRKALNDFGAWCEARIYETGLHTLEIYAPPVPTSPIPDFYSGALAPAVFYDVPAGQPSEFEGKKYADTTQTVQTLYADRSMSALFVDAGELYPLGDTYSGRFAIENKDKAGYCTTGVVDANGAEAPVPVAREVYATMYSGLMSEVVQFLLGVGKVTWSASLRDDQGKAYQYKREPAVSVKKAKKSKIVDMAEDESETQEIVYSWLDSRTHGVMRTTDGYPVLVEVTKSSMRACLLPVDPQTDVRDALFKDNTPFDKITHPVLDHIRSVLANEDAKEYHNYFNALLDVIKAFGGLPTGELPKAKRTINVGGKDVEVDNWITLLDEGAMKKWADTSSYSTGMGWAFSPTANQCRNTGWQLRGINTLAGYDFTIDASLMTSSESYTGLSGAANMTWRSGFLPSLPEVKFMNPAVNGLESSPARPKGSQYKVDEESQFKPFYMHVFYDKAGTLRYLQYHAFQQTPQTASWHDVKCPGVSERHMSVTDWVSRSRFEASLFTPVEPGGGSKSVSYTTPAGAQIVKRIKCVDDWTPAYDHLENYSYNVDVALPVRNTGSYRQNHTTREAYAVPLYDRCALYRFTFSYGDLASDGSSNGYALASVGGARPWMHRPDFGSFPWWTIPPSEPNPYHGCEWYGADSAWRCLGDVSGYVHETHKGYCYALNVPPSDNAHLGACGAFFKTHNISGGGCSSDPGPGHAANIEYTLPPVSPPVSTSTTNQWTTTLDLLDREGLTQVFTKRGSPPPGAGADPAKWKQVYGNWFTRSPDPDLAPALVYDYISASRSCLGDAVNRYYDKELNPSAADYELVTSFGYIDCGAPPNFIGVLNNKKVE